MSTNEGAVRKSISLRLIRHAQSRNNQVYREAHHLYQGGTPNFDEEGFNAYVDQRRSSDPGLSDKGAVQAQHLAKWLVPHLQNQASHPVRIISSPMRRTLETILPTIEQLSSSSDSTAAKVQLIVNAFYFESEGCHIRDKAEEGMNPKQIHDMVRHCFPTSDGNGGDTENKDQDDKRIIFEGFPEKDRGWYVNGTGAEKLSEAEQRAAKFYLWLCDYLDHQLLLANTSASSEDQQQSRQSHEDIFDAGVSLPHEEHECDHDQLSPRQRKRRTCLLIGHADFMGLVLKRIVTGFGHFIENEDVPHRSAFIHHNTGMTELEYFGNGRFLIMNSNHTPHIQPHEYAALRTGGSLKDGWSFIVPSDEFILDAEVSFGFEDELDTHVLEQTQALKDLYLKSTTAMNTTKNDDDDGGSGSGSSDTMIMTVGEVHCGDDTAGGGSQQQRQQRSGKSSDISFVVRRGLEVVGCASYNEHTGHVKDVIVRPTVQKKDQVGEMLLDAVKQHERKLGRSGSLLVQPDSEESKHFLKSLGFEEQMP
mmetsp:Transcript_17776/g.25018  ORF Transcript_17776/g.25018 Transcript_17776/m.25018 type:complete len:534 (+) Transcript_17776:151-1752(+)